MPELFKCSRCDVVISETLAFRTLREYGHSFCMQCEIAMKPGRITTKPRAPPDTPVGETVPLGSISIRGAYVGLFLPLGDLSPEVRERILREFGRII